MTGGSKDPSPGIDKFMARYNVQGFPTLLVLSPSGAVLVPEVGRSPAAMLAAAAKAKFVEQDFQAFRTAVEKHNDPALWAALAQAYQARAQHTEAVAVLQKLTTLDPAPRRYSALAEAQMAAELWADALKTYDALIAKEPSTANHVARAKAQAGSGDVDGAIAYLQAQSEKSEDAAAKKALREGAAGMLWDTVVRKVNAEQKFKEAVSLLDKLLKEFADTDAAKTAQQWAGQIRRLAGQ